MTTKYSTTRIDGAGRGMSGKLRHVSASNL